MIDDLHIPAFLFRVGPSKKVRSPRWKKIQPIPKPTSERYEDAERWELFLENGEHYMAKLGCGLRRFWVAEDETGAKWVWLHDGETEQRMPMDDWQRLSNKARRIA